jgi:hypothetical protein
MSRTNNDPVEKKTSRDLRSTLYYTKMENLNEQPVLQKEVDDQGEGEEGYAAVGNHADQP